MVLSDGMVHFLKIKIFFLNLPKLYCDFNIKITRNKQAITEIAQEALMDIMNGF